MRAVSLAGPLARLDPTAADKRRARDVLLGLLARDTGAPADWLLSDALAQLDPTVHDLRTWRAWTAAPTAELLAAMRRNSALAGWVALLPSLSPLSS
jgi:hypothetical protein